MKFERENYINLVSCFRSGQIPVKDFIAMLEVDPELSTFYKNLLNVEVRYGRRYDR